MSTSGGATKHLPYASTVEIVLSTPHDAGTQIRRARCTAWLVPAALLWRKTMTDDSQEILMTCGLDLLGREPAHEEHKDGTAQLQDEQLEVLLVWSISATR